MSDFHDLVQGMNGDDHERLSREFSLEILQRMTDTAPRTQDEWIRKELLPTIAKFVRAQTDPLKARIAELESQMKNWNDRGVFKSGETYYENNFVSYQGSLWRCRQSNTSAAPGIDETWRLVCKRGRDGKDAR